MSRLQEMPKYNFDIRVTNVEVLQSTGQPLAVQITAEKPLEV